MTPKKLLPTHQKMKRNRNSGHPQRLSLSPPGQLWHPGVPGPLWNGTRRVDDGQIQAYCRLVAREFRPRKIILFGSYANGSATVDSDVDLIVVMPFRGSATDKVVEIRGRVEAPFPLDMLLWRPAEEHKENSFTRGILSEGKVMYEAKRPLAPRVAAPVTKPSPESLTSEQSSQRYDRSAAIRRQNTMAVWQKPQKPYAPNSAEVTTPKKAITCERIPLFTAGPLL